MSQTSQSTARRADWPGVIREAWDKVRHHDSPAVAGASVNPPLIEPLEHVVKQATGQDVQWVGRNLDLPIKVLTDEPDKTGVDRVLNIAAAYEQSARQQQRHDHPNRWQPIELQHVLRAPLL